MQFVWMVREKMRLDLENMKRRIYNTERSTPSFANNQHHKRLLGVLASLKIRGEKEKYECVGYRLCLASGLLHPPSARSGATKGLSRKSKRPSLKYKTQTPPPLHGAAWHTHPCFTTAKCRKSMCRRTTPIEMIGFCRISTMALNGWPTPAWA